MTAQSAAPSKIVRVDIVSDTVCPWCFVGKKNLDKAMSSCPDIDVKVRWHAYQLNPAAPREGVNKEKFFAERFGDRVPAMMERMSQVFAGFGEKITLAGLTGNTLDSHRLLALAGKRDEEREARGEGGASLQDALVEELFKDYFTRGRYIGDRDVLVSAAERAGLTGSEARQWLEDPSNGMEEVRSDLIQYGGRVSGVPHFVIGGQQFSGAQPPEVLLDALKAAA